MEFLVICKTKLKITLNKAEVMSYGIKSKDGEYEHATVRSSLGEILARAEERTGFSVGGEQVLIQLYPTDSGGCEIFVTRLSALSKKDQKRLCESETLNTYSGRESVYMFLSKEDLCAAARALKDRGGKWDVYLSSEGDYYVRVIEHAVDGFSDFDILCEYATKDGAMPLQMLRERCKLICSGNGAEVFSKE